MKNSKTFLGMGLPLPRPCLLVAFSHLATRYSCTLVTHTPYHGPALLTETFGSASGMSIVSCYYAHELNIGRMIAKLFHYF